ncbi:uncharacterized protein LOC100207791 isoform X2 [Hydra vulgaris]|uniref:uncharacterized protein LOC100207791 isoform X2 n=1 Tax=Hydra vulgaris TaxID=6087 RepID=UPI001F5EF2DA|nr:uncharacterized protein LOC100207791 isoform X2 [Hydra vulgaris]
MILKIVQRFEVMLWLFVFANLFLCNAKSKRNNFDFQKANKRQYLVKPVDINHWSGPYFNERQTQNAFKNMIYGVNNGRKREELGFDARKILNLDPENSLRRLNIDENPVAETFAGDSSDRNTVESPQERLANMISKPIIHYEYSHDDPKWRVKEKLNKIRKEYSDKRRYENNIYKNSIQSEDENEYKQKMYETPFKRNNKLSNDFYGRNLGVTLYESDKMGNQKNSFNDDVNGFKKYIPHHESSSNNAIVNLILAEKASRRRFPEKEETENFHLFKTVPFFKRKTHVGNEINENFNQLGKFEKLNDERNYYSKDEDTKTHHNRLEDEHSVDQFLQSDMGLSNYHLIEKENGNDRDEPDNNREEFNNNREVNKLLKHDSFSRISNPYETENSLNEYKSNTAHAQNSLKRYHNSKRSTLLANHVVTKKNKINKRKLKKKTTAEQKVSKKFNVENSSSSSSKRWSTFQPNEMFQRHPSDFYGEHSQNNIQMIGGRYEPNNNWNRLNENDYITNTGFENAHSPVEAGYMGKNDLDVEMSLQPIIQNAYPGEISNHKEKMEYGEKLQSLQSHDHSGGKLTDDIWAHEFNANEVGRNHQSRHGKLMGFFGNSDQGALLPAETLDGIAANWEHAHQNVHYENLPHNKGDSMQGSHLMHDADYEQQLHNYMLLNNENIPDDSHHQEMSTDEYQNHINDLMMKYKPLMEKAHDGSDVSSYLYQSLIPHHKPKHPHPGYDYYAFKNPWSNMQIPYHIPVENHPLEDELKETTTEITTEAKPDFIEGKPELVFPKLVEAKTDFVEAKTESIEAKPELMLAKPEFLEAKPELIEAKPELVEAKPELIEAKPEHILEKPKIKEAKAELIEAKPELLKAQPEHFKENSEAITSSNLLKENLQTAGVGDENSSEPKTEKLNNKEAGNVNKSNEIQKSENKPTEKEPLKPNLGVKSPWGEAPSKIPLQHHRSNTDILFSDPSPIIQAYNQLNLLVPAALQIKALQEQLKEVKQKSALQIALLESKNKNASKSEKDASLQITPNKAMFNVNPAERLTSEAGLLSPSIIQELVAQAKNIRPTGDIKSGLETSSSSENKEKTLSQANLIQPSVAQKALLKLINAAVDSSSKQQYKDQKDEALKQLNLQTDQLKLLALIKNLQPSSATAIEKEHLNSMLNQIALNKHLDLATSAAVSPPADINSMLLKIVLKQQNPNLNVIKSKGVSLLQNGNEVLNVFDKEKNKGFAKQNSSEVIRLLIEKLQHKKHKKSKDFENPYAKIGYVGKRGPQSSQQESSNDEITNIGTSNEASIINGTSFNKILQSVNLHYNEDDENEAKSKISVKKSKTAEKNKNKPKEKMTHLENYKK